MIAQLVERETVVVDMTDISRSAVRLRLAGSKVFFYHNHNNIRFWVYGLAPHMLA